MNFGIILFGIVCVCVCAFLFTIAYRAVYGLDVEDTVDSSGNLQPPERMSFMEVMLSPFTSLLQSLGSLSNQVPSPSS